MIRERHEPLADFLFTYAGVLRPYPWTATGLIKAAPKITPCDAPAAPVPEHGLIPPEEIPDPGLGDTDSRFWYFAIMRNPALRAWISSNPRLAPPTTWPDPVAQHLHGQGLEGLTPAMVAHDWVPYHAKTSAYTDFYNLPTVAHFGLGALQALSLGLPYEVLPDQTTHAIIQAIALLPYQPTFWLWFRPWPLATIIATVRARVSGEDARAAAQVTWTTDPLNITRPLLYQLLKPAQRADTYLAAVPAVPWHPRSTVKRHALLPPLLPPMPPAPRHPFPPQTREERRASRARIRARIRDMA